jgi:hypothetical protein
MPWRSSQRFPPPGTTGRLHSDGANPTVDYQRAGAPPACRRRRRTSPRRPSRCSPAGGLATGDAAELGPDWDSVADRESGHHSSGPAQPSPGRQAALADTRRPGLARTARPLWGQSRPAGALEYVSTTYNAAHLVACSRFWPRRAGSSAAERTPSDPAGVSIGGAPRAGRSGPGADRRPRRVYWPAEPLRDR